MRLTTDELMTLRVILDTTLRAQTDPYHRAKTNEVKLKVDAEFNERLGFSALTRSASITPIPLSNSMPPMPMRSGFPGAF